jgi:phospholipase D1/2
MYTDYDKKGWVSPEVYLRRPPSGNEKYRLDRMLTAAAERGVQVKIIVYKEVPETIHRKFFTVILLLFLMVTVRCSIYNSPLAYGPSVESKHTKNWLENCHKNIQVFRHPDWYASPKGAASSLNTLAQGAMKGNVGINDLKNLGDEEIGTLLFSFVFRL